MEASKDLDSKTKMLKTSSIGIDKTHKEEKDKEEKDKEEKDKEEKDKEEKDKEEKDKDEKDKEEKNTELYKNVILEEYIYLKAADLNNKIDDIILLKLRKKIEGKCIKIGYVMPDSIKIIVRSLGIINNANFDGITTYKVQYTSDVCNPGIGQIIQCEIGNIDKSQIICYIDTPEKSPLEIYLFKHHHLGNTEFAALQKGDIVNVKIGGSKWEYKDKQIISIAQYVNKV